MYYWDCIVPSVLSIVLSAQYYNKNKNASFVTLYTGSTKLAKDIHSVDHNAPHSVSLVEECVRDEDCTVGSVVGDDGASVEKADKSSISEHYNRNSRRRHVVSIQRTTKQHDKSIDATSSMFVCNITCMIPTVC